MSLSFEPYWWDAAPPASDPAPAELPDSVDTAVVGAGFTGLAAARVLAAAGRDTLVLEARRLGSGASTRNGGMAGSGTRQRLGEIASRYGMDRAQRILRESLEAVDSLETMIRELGIECDFARTGRVLAAWRHRDLDGFARHAEDVNALRPGEAQLVDADRLQTEEVASRRYHGGLVLRTHGGLHPAKLHAGLLAATRAAGARFAPQMPVQGIERTRDGFRLRTPAGEVRAGEVIVATNGYTDRAIPWLRRRLLPIPSYVIASEPMPPTELAALIPGGRMIVESRHRYCYYRRSPDGTRLLFGGRASLAEIPLPRAAVRLQRMIADLFPEAAGRLRYSHCWTGFVAFTGSFLPFVARQDGIHYVGGYNGNGVALSQYLGRKAALLALGDPESETAFAGTRPETPTYYLLPGGLIRSGAEAVLRCQDLSDRTARRPRQRR